MLSRLFLIHQLDLYILTLLCPALPPVVSSSPHHQSSSSSPLRPSPPRPPAEQDHPQGLHPGGRGSCSGALLWLLDPRPPPGQHWYHVHHLLSSSWLPPHRAIFRMSHLSRDAGSHDPLEFGEERMDRIRSGFEITFKHSFQTTLEAIATATIISIILNIIDTSTISSLLLLSL